MWSIELGLLFLSLLLPQIFAATRRNITIDDASTDKEFTLEFIPDKSWEDQTCSSCFLRPDVSKVHGGTYRAATYDPALNKDFIAFHLSFQGSAVYAFFILANKDDRATTETMCNFTLDGEFQSTFHHVPDESTREFFYNQLAFSKDGLSPNEAHDLQGAITDGPTNYYIAFDYAIVTVEEEDETSTSQLPETSGSNSGNSQSSSSSGSISPNVGLIAGITIGALGIIAIAILLFICFRRRQRQQQRPVDLLSDAPLMNQNYPNVSQDPLGGHPQIMPFMGASASSSTGYLSHERRPNPSLTYYGGASDVGSSYRGLAYDETTVSGGTSTSGRSAARRATIRDARQRELENQVVMLRQQLDAVQSVSPGANVPQGATSPRSNKVREADEAEKAHLRNQVAEMHARIQQLEAAQSSAWAQGDSDEPPPGYTPTPDNR